MRCSYYTFGFVAENRENFLKLLYWTNQNQNTIAINDFFVLLETF